VKLNGKWLKPLKFVGYEYNGETGLFKSSTRKGKELFYDKEEMLKLLNERDIGWYHRKSGTNQGSASESRNSFYHLCNSRYKGFVQSRLYNGG